MAQDTITLAANAQRSEKISGKFFTVLRATAPFTVELDGRQRREVRAGSKISEEPFSRISFFETEGASNLIVYDAGEADFQGEIQVQQKVSSTYAVGNGGNFQFPTVKKAKDNLGSWGYTRNYAPTNFAADAIKVSGTNGGNIRKQITIQNTTLGATPNATDLILFDSSGRPFIRVKANDVPYTWETSADIYLMASGADITAGCVIINEIFYSDI